MEQSKKWYGRYTDAAGNTVRVPLTESKEIAKKMLAKIAGDAALGSVGISDPLAPFRARPLREFIEEHVAGLRAQGRTPTHCDKTLSRLLAIAKGCGFTSIDDLDPDELAEYLASLREDQPLPPMDPAKEWYTTAEAAPLVGITPASLRHLAVIGPLPGPTPKKLAMRRMILLHRDTVTGLVARRCRGLGVRTTNMHLSSFKFFSNWLAKKINRTLKNKDRLRHRWADPLADMEQLNARVDIRHQRRPLVPEDFDRFLAATRANKPYRGLAGEERAMLYLTAIYTGFRASELASLMLASFDLDAEPPTVTVTAAFSKHRREDVQPLRRDVAEQLRSYLAGRPRKAPVWPGKWPKGGAIMLRRDLAAAGIPYENEAGEVIDFHGLRHTFISALAAAGVRPKAAQELARHSTITLTQDYYTHLQLRDQVSALDMLPPPPAASAEEAPEEGKERRSA